MKCRIMLLVFMSVIVKFSMAQEQEWIVENTSTNPGERIVAVMDAGTIGSYEGVELIGQVIDNNGNWGYQLPTVANFRLYVKFSGGFGCSLKQDVKTSNVKLGLRKVSESEVHLVANCPYAHRAMRVIFKQIQGSLSVTKGNPNAVISEGELIVSEPNYESEIQITNKLEVHNGDNSYGAILARASETNFQLYSKTLTSQPTSTETFRIGMKYGTDERNGAISFYRGGSTSGGFLGFSTNGAERIRINTNGNVGIGTSKPTEKLTVDGTILAKEVRVSTEASDWPDFVFEDNYHLKDLSEVEAFVKDNKHLPEIPSAAEMEEAGVNLAEMNKLLLMKVEELTLYAIKQKAEAEKQKEAMESMLSHTKQALQAEAAKRKALEERLNKMEKILTNLNN